MADAMSTGDAVANVSPRGGGKLIDLTGLKFGRWTVVALHPKRKCYAEVSFLLWCCRCDCGNERLVLGNNLRRGLSKSCGCLNIEKIKERRTTHGHSRGGRGGRPSSIYGRWKNMRQRCSNPNRRDYVNYGGRGIGFCERWDKFENYYADVGDPPRGKSQDRINVNGNYEPNNFRWATAFEQAHNKRPAMGRAYDDDGENFAHDDDDDEAAT
jgi:hypothetical protein